MKLPTSNFTLDLHHPPPEPEHFQEVLDKLRLALQEHSLGTNNVPTKTQPITVLVTEGMTSPAKKRHTAKSIGSFTESQEDLLSKSSHRNQKNLEKTFRYLKSHSSNKSRNIMDSFSHQNGTSGPPPGEKAGRVRTEAGSRSFARPEKLILEPDVEGVGTRAPPTISWTRKFPYGSRTVTIPRGDRGFGFIMLEKKVRHREGSRISSG